MTQWDSILTRPGHWFLYFHIFSQHFLNIFPSFLNHLTISNHHGHLVREALHLAEEPHDLQRPRSLEAGPPGQQLHQAVVGFTTCPVSWNFLDVLRKYTSMVQKWKGKSVDVAVNIWKIWGTQTAASQVLVNHCSRFEVLPQRPNGCFEGRGVKRDDPYNY